MGGMIYGWTPEEWEAQRADLETAEHVYVRPANESMRRSHFLRMLQEQMRARHGMLPFGPDTARPPHFRYRTRPHMYGPRIAPYEGQRYELAPEQDTPEDPRQWYNRLKQS